MATVGSLIGVLFAGAWVQAAMASEAGNMEPREVPPPGSAVELLDKHIELVDWDDLPFEEFIAWLAAQGGGGVNVLPMWTSLHAEGVDPQRAISLTLKHVSVDQIMHEVMDQLSDGQGVTYQGHDNIIRIAARPYFERKLVLRVYDVSDILFRVPGFQGAAPQIDLSGQAPSGIGGGGQGVFTQGGANQQGEEEQEDENRVILRTTQLRDLILGTVEPASWADTPTQQQGGPGSPVQISGTGNGRIRVHYRSLVVLNTVEVHEQIAGWFARQGR